MFKTRPFRAQYLDQWNTRLCQDVTKPLVDSVVEAVLYDQCIPFEHTSEYRNIYSYDKLWENLSHYDPELQCDVQDEHFLAGIKFAFKQFAKPKSSSYFKPISLQNEAADLIELMRIKDTSSGLTAYGATKWEAMTVGLDKAHDVLVNGKNPSPALAGTRTQRKGKTRLVWNIPLEMILIEATVARNLVDYFKNSEGVMTLGNTSHEIGTRLRASSARNKFHCSIDYSQFDASVRSDLIHAGFSAMRSWYNLSDEILPGITVGQAFNVIERYFVCTPIVMPNKEKGSPTLVLGKRGGVPSGSYFTSIIDSFANVALIFAASRRFGFTIKSEDLYVLGDDCLFFTNQEIDLNNLSNYLRKFGFKTNPLKGSVGLSADEIEYLGRKWKNGFPIRKFAELVRGALYPEKYRIYDSELNLRKRQALNLLNSYLLTGYVEDVPVEFELLEQSFFITPNMTSGLTNYLVNEGMIPGRVVKRAIY